MRTRQDRCLLPITADAFDPFLKPALLVLGHFFLPFSQHYKALGVRLLGALWPLPGQLLPHLGRWSSQCGSHCGCGTPAPRGRNGLVFRYLCHNLEAICCFRLAPPSRLSVCSWEIPLATSCKQTFCLTLERVPGNLSFWSVASEKQPSCFGRRCSYPSLP